MPTPHKTAIIAGMEEELGRIQGNHLIADGLFIIPFGILDSSGKTHMEDFPALSLTRLHTWLALIPAESVADEALRQKLVITQKELTDLIYGYFGRTIMPVEMIVRCVPSCSR